MNSPAHDVVLYLQIAAAPEFHPDVEFLLPGDEISMSHPGGVGTLGAPSGWSLNAFREPDSPDDAITVYDTGGSGPDTDDQDPEWATMQVRVRSRSYLDAYSKHEEIRDLLSRDAQIVSATSILIGAFMTSDIMSLGRDDNDRFIL